MSLSVSDCWRCLDVKERKEGRGKGISVGRSCRMYLKSLGGGENMAGYKGKILFLFKPYLNIRWS
jgi:hypothetical protein